MTIYQELLTQDLINSFNGHLIAREKNQEYRSQRIYQNALVHDLIDELTLNGSTE